MSQPVQEKLAKVVRFFKQEIIAPGLDERRATDEFLSVCGTWEDDRTIEEQIKDIYSGGDDLKYSNNSSFQLATQFL